MHILTFYTSYMPFFYLILYYQQMLFNEFAVTVITFSQTDRMRSLS